MEPKTCFDENKKVCSFVKKDIQMTIILVMVKNKCSQGNVEAEGRESVYQTSFFNIGTLENYQFVRTFNQLHKIFPSDITKAGKKISILPGLVAFGLISCVGSYLSRPWDNENGSLHITKILLISCSLKAIKIFTLFIFTF